jgi:transcriptional regulator with XRE-family HTH domain
MEYQFRKRLRRERERLGWSQNDMAERLERQGFSFYGTTIAKVEAGNRMVGIAEAVAIADLLEVPLDTLLGRKPKPRRDLTNLLGAALDAVYTSRTGINRLARPLHDRLEDIGSDFPGYGTLAKCSDEVDGHLDMARKALEKLENQLLEIVDQRVQAEVDAELMGGSQE